MICCNAEGRHVRPFSLTQTRGEHHENNTVHNPPARHTTCEVTMTVTNRSTRKLRTIKSQYKREQPQPCMRCGQPINYEADPNQDPDAFHLGHIKSWRDHPELREDPANMRQEHRRCNLTAGADNGNTPAGLGQQSRTW